MAGRETAGVRDGPQIVNGMHIPMGQDISPAESASQPSSAAVSQDTAPKATDPSPRTGRLELTGRMNGHPEERPRQRSISPGKRAIPSLDDIRAHVTKKGIAGKSAAEVKAGAPCFSRSSGTEHVAGKSDDDVPHTASGTETNVHSATQDAPNASSSNNSEAVIGTQKTTSTAEGGAAGAAAKAGQTVHPMEHVWTLYYDCQRFHGMASSDQYEATLKRIGQFSTLESFFDTFATLHRPSRLEKNANYHIFKDDVKPMWEDPANANGGRWVLTLRDTTQSPIGAALHEAVLNRSWLWLVLGLIGEDFDPDNLVTGAVCSIRGKGDRITLWLRIKEPIEKVNEIGRRLLEFLEIADEPGYQLEFGTNSGEKDNRYMHLRNSTRQGGKAASNAAPQGPLGAWLDKEVTLHPSDHARVVAMREANARNDGAGAA